MQECTVKRVKNGWVVQCSTPAGDSEVQVMVTRDELLKWLKDYFSEGS